MKSLFTGIVCISVMVGAIACDKQNANKPQETSSASSTPTQQAGAAKSDIHTISLPTIATELPPGPGQATMVSACTICHSPRYVTMQPNFSKKKWTEEVDKMKKVYGAPILDEQVEPIVNYLVAIRGNGQ